MQSGRKHPIHLPPIDRHNKPIILLVTVCTYQRKKILASDNILQLLKKSWQEATSWKVGRFVVMPDHLHLFCSPAEFPSRNISDWIRLWKASSSRAWPRREDHPIWQKDSWDRQLRNEEHYGERWDYVKNNPVRQSLVASAEEWKWQGEANILPW